MPLMRNPFKSKPIDVVHEEGVGPQQSGPNDPLHRTQSGRSTSSGLDSAPPREYKLSEIDHRGVYIPPSPSETKSSFWSTISSASTRTSSHRSMLNENEPFSISRESFDSYRRSFDISARSPVIDASPIRPRQSFDARQLRLPPALNEATSGGEKKGRGTRPLPRDSPPTTFYPQPQVLPDNHVNPPSHEPEEAENPEPQAAAGEAEELEKSDPASKKAEDHFEDVGLGEPADKSPPAFTKQPGTIQPKKPSIFARFGGSSTPAEGHHAPVADRPGSSGLSMGLGMFGRKRGTSGQGAELGSIQQPRQGPSS